MNKILANLRKYLDKNSIIGSDGYAVVQDHNALMEYIKTNNIPLAIRENADGTFCIIIVERMPTKKDEKNLQKFTKYFYILEDRFIGVGTAQLWMSDKGIDMSKLTCTVGNETYKNGWCVGSNAYIKF